MFNLSRDFLIMLSLCVYNDLYGCDPSEVVGDKALSKKLYVTNSVTRLGYFWKI